VITVIRAAMVNLPANAQFPLYAPAAAPHYLLLPVNPVIVNGLPIQNGNAVQPGNAAPNAIAAPGGNVVQDGNGAPVGNIAPMNAAQDGNVVPAAQPAPAIQNGNAAPMNAAQDGNAVALAVPPIPVPINVGIPMGNLSPAIVQLIHGDPSRYHQEGDFLVHRPRNVDPNPLIPQEPVPADLSEAVSALFPISSALVLTNFFLITLNISLPDCEGALLHAPGWTLAVESGHRA
jgi:hypothetical protein